MMVVKLTGFLVLLATVFANDYMHKYIHDKKACTMCHHKYFKYSIKDIKTDTQSDEETTRLSHESHEADSKTLELNNNETNNTTPIPTTTAVEVKSTENGQTTATKEEMNTASSQIYSSYSPNYEVHENVVDIPDDRTPAGPIVATYTRPPQFNTIKPTDTTPTNTATTDIDKFTQENIKDKKHLFTLLHVKVETDDKPKEENKVSGIFKGIKNYFTGIQKGLVDGIHGFFNKKNQHGHRHQRSADAEYVKHDNRGRQSSDNVDKTEFFVRRQHISLT